MQLPDNFLQAVCFRGQCSDDLRRAICDSVWDDNFDESTAPRRQLDFEIVLCDNETGKQLPMFLFLLERKTFQDFFESQKDGRLQSQLNSLAV